MDVILIALADVIGTVLSLYSFVIIVAVLITWVNPDPYNPIVRILRTLTEPVLTRARQWLPFLVIGGIDLSPIAVILAIQFLNRVIPQLLYRAAAAI
ncbi:MAG: YggT family protein [Proteobacteria bacterium]|nr:YggT family protein [Pseudomonadota bacterium]MBU1612135.1 YggT family protein [Pseudomonadota bacterium]